MKNNKIYNGDIMDPVTQGVLGASLPLLLKNPTQTRWAAFCGLMGGLAPDLDSLIRSDQDPLLYLEYHRQFTHSLLFVPVGGFICAVMIFWIFQRWHGLTFKRCLLFCTLGYGTHGLLDAATSYGTQLFWPFSQMRVAGQIISIVDPLFTLPLLLCCGLSFYKRKSGWMVIGLIWAGLYMGGGALQNQRAKQMAENMAQSRGHLPERLSVKPSFGNLILWKSIYLYEGRYYVDALHAGIKTRVYDGQSIAQLDRQTFLSNFPAQHIQRGDLARFTHFSNGFIAQSPDHPYRVIDMRYSLLPHRINPLWYLEMNPKAAMDQHADFIEERKPDPQMRQEFMRMLKGD